MSHQYEYDVGAKNNRFHNSFFYLWHHQDADVVVRLLLLLLSLTTVITWLLVKICSFARCKSKTVFLWPYISSEVILTLSCFVRSGPLACFQVGFKLCYYSFLFPAFLVRCLSLFYVIELLDRWNSGIRIACFNELLPSSRVSSGLGKFGLWCS